MLPREGKGNLQGGDSCGEGVSKLSSSRCKPCGRSPYSLTGDKISHVPTCSEGSTKVLRNREIYLEPPEPSDVIGPFEADGLQAFIQAALDRGEPAHTSPNHRNSFLGHGLQRRSQGWLHVTCPKGRMTNAKKTAVSKHLSRKTRAVASELKKPTTTGASRGARLSF